MRCAAHPMHLVVHITHMMTQRDDAFSWFSIDAALHMWETLVLFWLLYSNKLVHMTADCAVLVSNKTDPSSASKRRPVFYRDWGQVQLTCTVPLISPVQHVYLCSETRHCKHRDQCARRCGTAQQVEQSAISVRLHRLGK